MRVSVGCAVALFTLFPSVLTDAASRNLREFDFRVSNLQLNGVQRTVVNGLSLNFHLCHPADGAKYASSRPISG